MFLADLVIGANGDGGKLNLPDGVVSRLDGGKGRVLLPLLHDGDYEQDGQAQVAEAENDPQEPKSSVASEVSMSMDGTI